MSPNGPVVFEFECGRGSSLLPLPHRRRRRPRTSGVGVKGRKSARRFAELLPDVDDLRPDNDKQTPTKLHETIWSEIAEDERLPEMYEIAGQLVELCQRNEMEKHGKSNEIKCQIETETRRMMWDIVEEIYRDWKVSPTTETSYDFWDEDDEDEDGHPIIRVEEQEWLEVIQNLLTVYL